MIMIMIIIIIIIIIIIMLFNQGAHITKGVIQWGPTKKEKKRKEKCKIWNSSNSLKNTIFKCSIKTTG